jgi:hypothetical protein
LDFERDVRPLLREHCVSCHGPDKQKGGLRLDARAFVFRGGHDGPAVRPGHPDTSPLFRRVSSPDADERMPPEGEPPLAASQIASLRAWIAAGAVWPETDADRAAAVDPRAGHWAVQPVRADFPADATVDGFLRAALAEHGLAMSPEADRRTLIRRLSFDLHGLPPSPERVEAFVRDPDPRAYERLVEELLASPHYGERWARHWLDIAHYADTHGFERDQLRPHAWRYRDYVIDSLNADKPYDRFLREQIAGDVLAPGDPASVVATGFLAAGPWDFVGQVETKSDLLKRAARAGDLDDMVTQVITSTMGITIHCARCHDHKLDPITQREYYSLCSVFAGVTRTDRDVAPEESARLAAEKTRLTRSLAQTRAEIARLAGDGFALASLLPESSGIDLRLGTVTQTLQGYHRDIQTNRLQKVDSLPGVKWVFVPDGRGTVTVDFRQSVSGIPATSGHAWDTIANRPLNAQRGSKLGGTDYHAPGHTLLAMHANSGITFDLATLRARSGLRAMRLTGVVGFGAGPEAAASRADFTVVVDSSVAFQALRLRKDETATLDVVVPASARTLSLLATDGGDGIGNDLLFLGDPKLVPESPPGSLAAADAVALRDLRAEALRLDTELGNLPEPAKVFAIATADPPPVVRVQRRGNPEDEGEEVTPGAFAWASHAPAAFGDQTLPEGERRRALAAWITHPDNPLTRRVIANRLWHHHFGQGLVATPSDFGLGGGAPSHPELLDWLADQLLRGGWSLKHLHRLIVTSAAYRQRSDTAPGPASSQADAANRLLWRQNPRRLDAESLHDAVLAVAGTLQPQRGGPGFRDFRYTEAYAPVYEYVTPDRPDLWRRSIYRFVVRTTPHAFLTTLDCPDPANLTPVRIQTTTALQALTLSNSGFMLLQARHFAARAEAEAAAAAPEAKAGAPSPEASLRRAFALAFQREPTPDELRAALPLVADQSLFALCRLLFNANEFVHVD